MTTQAAAYQEHPYPGQRPANSFVQLGGDVHAVDAVGPPALWRFGAGGGLLDDWLMAQGTSPMAARTPLLSYGSNACPSKLLRLQSEYALTGPVVMTKCTVTGAGAAWCAGTRHADGSVPATLAQAPVAEEHFLWWVDEGQWDALDACEGSRPGGPGCYDLVVLDPGICQVHGQDGAEVHGVHAYVGAMQTRLPMLDADGHPILVNDVGQAGAKDLLLAGRRPRGLRTLAALGGRVQGRSTSRLVDARP